MNEASVIEIINISDNSEGFYNRKMMMWKNLYAKHKRGVFDSIKAEKLFDYLTTSISRYYKDEFGTAFSKQDRNAANKALVSEFVEALPEIEKGDIDVKTVMTPQVVRARSGKYYNPVRARATKKQGIGMFGIVAVGIAAYLILKK